MDNGKKGDFLGASILIGDVLKKLLSRQSLQAQEPLEFKLGLSKYIDIKKQDLVRKSGGSAILVLSGGLKAIEVESVRPDTSVSEVPEWTTITAAIELPSDKKIQEIVSGNTDISGGAGSVEMLKEGQSQVNNGVEAYAASLSKKRLSSVDRIKLTVVSAKALPKVSFLGSTFPYVIVTMNDTEIGRTSIVRGQNPNFEDTKESDFVLDKHSGIEYDDSNLLLELYHSTSSTSTNPEKDVFLGQVSVSSEELLSENLFSTEGLLFNLETSSRYQMKKQKYVDKSASLLLKASIASDIEPSMLSDINSYSLAIKDLVVEVDISERIPAEISILAAIGLPSPMKFLSSKSEVCSFY